MAGRAKTELIDIDKCKQFARSLFGLQQTPFFIPQYKFAEQTAELAKDILLSRNEIEYFAAIPVEKRFHDAEVTEAAAILANTVQNGWATYDNVVELSSVEVANYLQYVNINKNESLFRSTANMLSQLCVCNNDKSFGPIFIVLARALVLINTVGAKPNASMLGPNSVSYATQLWSAYHVIKELERAQVPGWSEYTKELFEQIKPILESWKYNTLVESINFKGSVCWKLDTSLD